MSIYSCIDDIQDAHHLKKTVLETNFSRTVHMYPEYFSEKPTERLLGKGILPSHINEDVMGRFLDSLYEEGVSELYQEIAARVVAYLNLRCNSLNFDATSFHLDSQYEHDINAQAIHITRGYSRDHRPDLNQVVLTANW